MRTIGLLGGMSWESTATYYRYMNRLVAERMGGLASAKILMASVNFAPYEEALSNGDDDFLRDNLVAEARKLEAGGAGCIVLATNTMHRFAPDIEAATAIPFLHIADGLGKSVTASGHKKIGLLGTRFTMTQDFYSARLADAYGIETIIPDAGEIDEIDRIIFDELCRGDIRDGSRARYLEIMEGLAGRGAESIALACTEIELLVEPKHTKIKLHDTTMLHAVAAVDWAVARLTRAQE